METPFIYIPSASPIREKRLTIGESLEFQRRLEDIKNEKELQRQERINEKVRVICHRVKEVISIDDLKVNGNVALIEDLVGRKTDLRYLPFNHAMENLPMSNDPEDRIDDFWMQILRKVKSQLATELGQQVDLDISQSFLWVANIKKEPVNQVTD